MSLALGVGDLEEHASALAALIAPPRAGASPLAQLVGALPELAHIAPRRVSAGTCQDVVLDRDWRRPSARSPSSLAGLETGGAS